MLKISDVKISLWTILILNSFDLLQNGVYIIKCDIIRSI